MANIGAVRSKLEAEQKEKTELNQQIANLQSTVGQKEAAITATNELLNQKQSNVEASQKLISNMTTSFQLQESMLLEAMYEQRVELRRLQDDKRDLDFQLRLGTSDLKSAIDRNTLLTNRQNQLAENLVKVGTERDAARTSFETEKIRAKGLKTDLDTARSDIKTLKARLKERSERFEGLLHLATSALFAMFMIIPVLAFLSGVKTYITERGHYALSSLERPQQAIGYRFLLYVAMCRVSSVFTPFALAFGVGLVFVVVVSRWEYIVAKTLEGVPLDWQLLAQIGLVVSGVVAGHIALDSKLHEFGELCDKMGIFRAQTLPTSISGAPPSRPANDTEPDPQQISEAR